ncbi:MAG: 30S ribosomal protein S21 [Candidatus Liptonbacteria bacterium]|nr:30S ribosomal protein S21 [Candidatus Liptonbacteria bacterium]
MPAVEVKKRGGESTSALLYRFSKKVRQSGVVKEFRKRKFHGRTHGKRQRRLSALHREKKKTEIKRMKKLGLI